MKTPTALAVIALSSLFLTGCETPYGTPDRAGTGALTGGAIGVASGLLIGGRHHAAEGAIIGGAVGAVTGGLIGHSMDVEHQNRLLQQAPQTYTRVDQGQPMSVADIKALARAGVGDDVIISQIRSTRSSFQLGANDIIDLKQSGVSEKVLEFMINSPGTATGTAVMAASAPPAPPTETIVIAPGPEYVWVGGEWEWHGRWVWVGGHWHRPPRPHAVWVRTNWHHGPRGYYRVGGYWSY